MMTKYKRSIQWRLCFEHLSLHLLNFFIFTVGFLFFFKLGTIPTDLEQATGVERKELEAILSGNPVGIVFMIISLYFYD